MLGDLVPVEDGLELWWFRPIYNSWLRGQTLHDIVFRLMNTLLRVDLLVVELAQLVFRDITFLIN